MPYVVRPKCQKCGNTAVKIFYDVHEPAASRQNQTNNTLYPSVKTTLKSLLPNEQTTTAEAADCETVLLSHGFGSGSELWKNQVPEMLKAGFRVVLWDMCGHAKSDSPHCECCYSKQHQIDDMNLVLEKVSSSSTATTSPTEHSPRVILCGHSMGGYDSLLYYFTHPDRVSAMILYGTGPGFAKDKARLSWNEMAVSMSKRYQTEGLAALRGSDKHKGHQSAIGLVLSCKRVFAQNDDDALFINMGTDGALTTARHLDRITVPVSIIVGERDKGFLYASQVMQKRIKAAKLRIVTGAGHLACERDPTQFNQILVEELERLKKEVVLAHTPKCKL